MKIPFKKNGVIFLVGFFGFFVFGFIFLLNSVQFSIAQSNSKGNMEQTLLPKNFNHDATAFPILGAHRELKCADCHLGGKFTGLPTTCENCHNNQMAYGKPQNHFRTSQNCDVCHSQTAWSPVTFRHDLAVVGGQCSNCHNGREATGKPQNHMMTTAQCDTCHTTSTWAGAKFKHDLSTVSGQCTNCHTGREATGKPQNHIATTAQCDTCHSTTTWAGAQFKHELTVIMGQCSNCHNGREATGKPQNHITTTAQCDMCHQSTTGWIPVNFGSHDNPRLIGAHSRLDCKACHTQSIPGVFYRDGTQYGFCANCHTRDYKPNVDKHNNIQADAMCANCHKHADYREF